MPRDAASKTEPDRDPAAALLGSAPVRERCHEILGAVLAEEAGTCFRVRLDRLGEVAAFVADVTRRRYPDLQVPPHSRWRHFRLDGRDLWPTLAERAGLTDEPERARAAVDLAVVSVLLDAGAGDAWTYTDPETGSRLSRSEGLAVASLRLFETGSFDSRRRPRVDAAGLEALDATALARGLQVGSGNPLVGIDGRLSVLHGLALALRRRPDLFGDDARPGGLVDAASAPGDGLEAERLLGLVLDGLGPIWPGRLRLAGRDLGDCWRHPAVRRDDPTDGLVPFHKLSQWLAYSLVEPLAGAGVGVRGLDRLTGLAEYRNGGLLVDRGVLEPRVAMPDAPLAPGSLAVVEWRALTVALLDRLLPLVRDALGLDAQRLSLPAMLEGGTWAAGRLAAADRRRGGGPPLAVASDGTLF